MNLVILAAGFGSRYGGLKQIETVGINGEVILDFSIYDAVKSGVQKIIFVIREEMSESFSELMFARENKYPEIEFAYAFQTNEIADFGFENNPERQKPWGTGHALLSAESQVDSDFIVINADDFYGNEAYQATANFFKAEPQNSRQDSNDVKICLVAYELEKTLSDSGSVSRGICQVSQDSLLLDIEEFTEIMRKGKKIFGKSESNIKKTLAPETPVSMNFWGFSQNIFPQLSNEFCKFLQEYASSTTAEFYLPTAINQITSNKTSQQVQAKVLKPNQQKSNWLGMTYREDLPIIKQALAKLQKNNIYPKLL